MRNIGLIIVVVVVGYVGLNMFNSSSGPQAANLGQVLDRANFAFERYDAYLKEEKVTEVGEKEMGVLTEFMTEVMNADPRFYDSTVGVALMKDSSFLGYRDANANKVQDEGEDKIFTLEIDSENKRMIATDGSGNGSHMGFSGAGFLAGALMGHLLSRQMAAGVRPGSFNNRSTVDRSSYRAPASARSRSRSGGLARGK